MNKSLLKDTYSGPREFLSLVYCLGYGENDALEGKVKNTPNKGTPQFWSLLAACSRGVDHVAITNSKKILTSKFAQDLLKGGQLPVEKRLEAKLQVLENLRDRGIWLLDVSIFGWYITQPQEYVRSSISNEVHRKQKSRPPRELKTPSLVLSWELFTKHVIRDLVQEGHLKLLIPIGMEVEAALTRERIEATVQQSEARVSECFPGKFCVNMYGKVSHFLIALLSPAPNAWIPGGYGPFHAKLAALVNEVVPINMHPSHSIA